MKALNRAFEKAFAHSEDDDSIQELLACMGEELGCERISIFEENDEGTCDNTYEWCSPGVVREQIVLQGVEIEKFDTWHDRLVGRETIVVHAAEELRETDPDVYAMFVDEQIHRAIVMLLAFHGKNFGFCILEDPSDVVMADEELIVPGIRYILSSLIYSRNLVARLRRIGYTDALTGAGNRISLQEYLEHLDAAQPFGVIAADVLGWSNAEGKIAHLEREQTLLRAADILAGVFDGDHVFRIATGEFVIALSGLDEPTLQASLRIARGLFREHNLLVSTAGTWADSAADNVDALIHKVREEAEAQRRPLLAQRELMRRERAAKLDGVDSARIALPTGDDFFHVAEEFLSDVYEGSVACVVVDINYFKLYNDIFGRRAGNVFLESVADVMQTAAKDRGGVCGYLGGDNFCILVSVKLENHQDILPALEAIYQKIDFPDGFYPAMGVYVSDDRRESMITLYDRALSAVSEIKGEYMRHIRIYSPESHERQREDKLLLMKVKEGLAKGEFVFYVQPQVHERTGKIIGGEALVRWLHDGMLISPGKFVPILEKTGHIYTVDTVVWESVAKWLRSLVDRGIAPVPISVNVSRLDFYFDDIAEHFIQLTNRYEIEPSLMGIEITESAFTDNMDTIMDAVQRLHEAGFHILMDDFGSGSSSLSMLHTMNLDVLKTDVKFMSKDDRDSKAISIVESIISMAHMIGMSVVTEGVETESQKDSLVAMGDSFAQGFYFYRPMPREEFEQLIADEDNVTVGYGSTDLSSDNQLKFRNLVRDGLVSETLLDNIIRAAAVYKEEAGNLSIVQLNEGYSSLTGIAPESEMMLRFADRLAAGELEKLKGLMERAASHPLGGSEGTIRFMRDDGTAVDTNMRVFLLYALNERRLFLSTMG